MHNTPCEPTPEDRRMVRAFAGFGVPQEDIARHLGLDPKTLRKHFRDELDRGIVEANAKVAQSLFQMATQGKNVAAAIFWMKARGRWREKHGDDPTEVSEGTKVEVHIVRLGADGSRDDNAITLDHSEMG